MINKLYATGWMTFAFVAGVACSGNAGRRAVQSSDIITRAELSRTAALNAYEAVQRLRPQFFKDRGRTSILRTESRTPTGVLDDRPLGDMSTLRDIAVTTVYEIRYLSASQAQVKYGSGYPAGAIVVVSARVKEERP